MLWWLLAPLLLLLLRLPAPLLLLLLRLLERWHAHCLRVARRAWTSRPPPTWTSSPLAVSTRSRGEGHPQGRPHGSFSPDRHLPSSFSVSSVGLLASIRALLLLLLPLRCLRSLVAVWPWLLLLLSAWMLLLPSTATTTTTTALLAGCWLLLD